MKKSFARVFSMLLALIMLLGMGASAETHKITLDVNGPDGLKLDGILTAGYDEDGCEQCSIENSMIGKWLLQSDGADLVFGGDQMGYYTVSAEDLSKAVTTVVSAIASQQLGEEFVILMNYAASPSYQMDLNAIVTILAGEVSEPELAAFLTAAAKNPVTADELAGAARAMSEAAVKVDIGGLDAVDIVGRNCR